MNCQRNIKDNNILAEANKLHKQALIVLSNLKVRKVLSTYGKLEVFGSLSYGLMTWEEIDLDLITKKNPDDENYWKIVKHFFSLSSIKLVALADNRQGKEKNRPKSMYIGLRYEDSQNKTWKIDIRILREQNVTSDAVSKLINDQMTDSHKMYILQIKSQVCHNPSYHKDFSSIDIYKAVIEDGVKTLAQFKNYLIQSSKK
ncbi:MAG: hypothetical protein U9O78_01940 [Patescibacteria group bacterium]|nr:hypothetical protein [Patescibacteria group bacterium]